jgi:hypothetical protein
VDLVVADVVHVQAEPVSRLVHEELPIRLRFDQARDAPGEQPELFQTSGDLYDRRIVGLVPVVADQRRLGCGDVCAQNHLVELALRRTENAVHGPRPRDVGCIQLELAARVDQHEIAVGELRVVRVVVQHARVRARGDDRRIRAFGAVTAKLVEKLRFELIFHHAGLRGPHRARVRSHRDLG